jgi:hypothetical protein
MIFVSWKKYGRASGRFGRAVSYVGGLGGNQERLGRTLLLPCRKTTTKLLFAPCEELTPILMKFALSFLFWTYFTDNSNNNIVSVIVGSYLAMRLSHLIIGNDMYDSNDTR